MGYVRHHSIAISCCDPVEVKKIHKKAKKIFGRLVTDICLGVCNGYESFFIAPDGSKEGWEDSQQHDRKREKFINYLRKKAPEESTVQYCHFFWGDDFGKAGIEDNN